MVSESWRDKNLDASSPLNFEGTAANSSGTNDEDASDMLAVMKGSDDAFNRLVKRHAHKLRKHVYRMLRDTTDTSVAVSESFVRVYQNRNRFRCTSKFSSWLYAIATNLALSRLRWRARQPEFIALDTEDQVVAAKLEERLVDLRPTPDAQMEIDEMLSSLDGAIEALPTKLQTPIFLTALEEKSQKEVAVHLQCSVKTVEMRLYHARNRLRDQLEEVPGKHEGILLPKRRGAAK